MIGKKKKELADIPAAAPEEQTVAAVLPQEVTEQQPVQESVPAQVPAPAVQAEQPQVVYVPQYLSQDQINNLVVETHLMVKEILTIANED